MGLTAQLTKHTLAWSIHWVYATNAASLSAQCPSGTKRFQCAHNKNIKIRNSKTLQVLLQHRLILLNFASTRACLLEVLPILSSISPRSATCTNDTAPRHRCSTSQRKLHLWFLCCALTRRTKGCRSLTKDWTLRWTRSGTSLFRLGKHGCLWEPRLEGLIGHGVVFFSKLKYWDRGCCGLLLLCGRLISIGQRCRS